MFKHLSLLTIFVFHAWSVPVNITGIIQSSSGGPVAGAMVALLHDQSISTASGSDGSFSLIGNSIGAIKANKPEYSSPFFLKGDRFYFSTETPGEKVTLKITDVGGRLLWTASQLFFLPGRQTISLKGNKLSTGIYCAVFSGQRRSGSLLFLKSGVHSVYLRSVSVKHTARATAGTPAAPPASYIDSVQISKMNFLQVRLPITAYQSDLGVVVLTDTTGFTDSAKIWLTAAAKYPDFITPTDDYFVTRTGDVPAIDKNSYRLVINGLVSNPCSLSLPQLYSLSRVELPLTVECIGNDPNGDLVSTAVWQGFNVYRLLDSLGLDSAATGVKYIAADGYYATHTIDQLKNNNVIGALFLNDDTIPPIQGFPLRILNPGYYGVKQPAWVVQIEVIGMPANDYWDDRGWDTKLRMPITSHFFFPVWDGIFSAGDSIEVGGAAFGGTRAAQVEVSIDNRLSWRKARIIKSMDADNVWVFWYAKVLFSEGGQQFIYARATDIYGNVEPQSDDDPGNGNNAQPFVIVDIAE
jgi:DMSO/TMAO reductase YedYZ molybdopterin-dependent catalytic subunit